jgi:hypothetical protein
VILIANKKSHKKRDNVEVTLLGLYCGGSLFEFRPQHQMSDLNASVVFVKGKVTLRLTVS